MGRKNRINRKPNLKLNKEIKNKANNNTVNNLLITNIDDKAIIGKSIKETKAANRRIFLIKELDIKLKIKL